MSKPKENSMDFSGMEIECTDVTATGTVTTPALVASSSFSFGGTAISATAAELNRATDISARVVTTTATTLSVTVTEHADRVVLINTNSASGFAATLPVAAATGAKFTFINGIAQTQGSITVACTGTLDTLKGVVLLTDTTAATAKHFVTSATSDKIVLGLTTTGGIGPGDIIEVWDTVANGYVIRAHGLASGTLATPFSAS